MSTWWAAIAGSGTSSTTTSCRPLRTTCFMGLPFSGVAEGRRRRLRPRGALGPGRKRPRPGPAVEERPAPQLEGDEGPDLEVQLASLVVAPQEALDVPRVEEAAPPGRLRQEQLADEGAQPAAEPAAQGDGKALLGPAEDRRGDEAAQRALEDVLARPSPQLQLGGDGGRELDELVVQQGHARLDRVGHAHAVHLGEDVEREVLLDVQVLERREPVPISRAQVGGRLPPGIARRHQREDLGREQLTLLLAPEER